MDNSIHTSFNASDRSYFSILKKDIHNIVAGGGFSEQKTAEIDIIVAEMASNLVKHGGGGEILLRLITDGGNPGVELISIDNGKGMSDPLKMLEDGISTSNTLGQGLGAIKRLSETFQIYSLKDWGTIQLSRVYKEPFPAMRKATIADVRSVIVPKPGETASGDGFAYTATSEHFRLFIGDGLGHGEEASKAINKALQSFTTSKETSPEQIIRHVHNGVKKTRGLVGTAAVYSFKEKVWRICGVGNISTRTQIGQSVKNYMSYNGIIGLNIPNTLNEQEVPGERGQLIILCSDGIRTRWELQKYTGIYKFDLSIIAAAIYKDFSRKTDDMCVIVGRIARQ
jgi:anti-sigma regulatory factor (Ser/Thr protein kinase)